MSSNVSSSNCASVLPLTPSGDDCLAYPNNHQWTSSGKIVCSNLNEDKTNLVRNDINCVTVSESDTDIITSTSSNYSPIRMLPSFTNTVNGGKVIKPEPVPQSNNNHIHNQNSSHHSFHRNHSNSNNNCSNNSTSMASGSQKKRLLAKAQQQLLQQQHQIRQTQQLSQPPQNIFQVYR